QPLAKRDGRTGARRIAVADVPDHWHRLLLRARRPCHGAAAHKRDEVPPPHLNPSSIKNRTRVSDDLMKGALAIAASQSARASEGSCGSCVSAPVDLQGVGGASPPR